MLNPIPPKKQQPGTGNHILKNNFMFQFRAGVSLNIHSFIYVSEVEKLPQTDKKVYFPTPRCK